MESDAQLPGSLVAEVSRNRVGLAGIRRAIDTIRWGRKPRDRALIAAYYGLLTGFKLFGGRHGIGMFPGFWLGDVAVETPIGRFACRARTTDFDIVNPNHEAELVRGIERRLARAPNGDSVFVDVGAHVGKYTILAARLLGSGGRVGAIEPEPAHFAAVPFNVALHGLHNLQAVHAGCLGVDGARIRPCQRAELRGP